MRISSFASLFLGAALLASPLAAQAPAQSPDSPSQPAGPSPASVALKAAAAVPRPDENFQSLPVDRNNLKLEVNIVGEIDDKPAVPFVRERLHLMWRGGDPIDVYIIRPRGVEKPPVVIYLYSYPQDTDRFKQDSWCGAVTSDGFAAVGFVSALTGHRLEMRAPKESFFNQLPEALGATTHDVQLLIDFLETRKDLDTSRLGMFGQGSGGSIAILASAVDPRIKSIDLLTPWGDWPLFIQKSAFIPSEDRLLINTPEFLAQVAPIDPLTWLPKVKARSIRLQDVRHTGQMPDAAQEKMEKAAPEIAEINQFGDSAALVPMAANGRLLTWIKSSLLPPVSPVAEADKSQRIHFYPAKRGEEAPLGAPH